jgi:hypothetical protein
MVELETRTSSYLYIALRTSEFCLFFFLPLSRKHTTLNLSSFQNANVHCVIPQIGSGGWQKEFVFPLGLSVDKAPFPPYASGPLANAKLKCWCGNLEPEKVRWIKLFKREGSRRWKKSLFSHFQICLLME